MTNPLSFASSSRSLKADGENGIFCSSYTDVHVVNFSYTIDTVSKESIQSAIAELESRALVWLAESLLPCNGGRVLDAATLEFANAPVDDPEDERGLRPDVFNELGIVGLKSWPDDVLSSSSQC
jgi:hypothetical protein